MSVLMGRMKDQLGDTPRTIGTARRLGAEQLLVTCGLPCRQRAYVDISALRLPDETPIVDVTKLRRLVCSACDRRAGPDAISIDWKVTASKPRDLR